MDKESSSYGSLTKLGHYQAGCIAKRLKELPISKIHSSSLLRAKETALTVVEKFSDLELKSHHSLKEGLPYVPSAVIKRKNLDKLQIKLDKERMEKAFKSFFKANKKEEIKHEALICHGNIIRFFLCKSLGVPIEAWSNFEVYQCSLSVIKITKEGKMVVKSVGESGHIPLVKRTII